MHIFQERKFLDFAQNILKDCSNICFTTIFRTLTSDKPDNQEMTNCENGQKKDLPQCFFGFLHLYFFYKSRKHV